MNRIAVTESISTKIIGTALRHLNHQTHPFPLIILTPIHNIVIMILTSTSTSTSTTTTAIAKHHHRHQHQHRTTNTISTTITNTITISTTMERNLHPDPRTSIGVSSTR